MFCLGVLWECYLLSELKGLIDYVINGIPRNRNVLWSIGGYGTFLLSCGCGLELRCLILWLHVTLSVCTVGKHTR